MKQRILGIVAILAVLGLWFYMFVLAGRWMEYLRVVNDDRWGYIEIGMLPIGIPLVAALLLGLWIGGPPIGKVIADWLSR